MKKFILALSVASFAGFGAAVADFDLGAACTAAVADSADLTDDQKTAGCECMVAGTDDAMNAGFEAGEAAASASGNPEEAAAEWTEEGAALVAECFPTAE